MSICLGDPANLDLSGWPVVAVDEITPELQRIIEYLSKNTVADLIVIALEFVYVSEGDVQILIPESYDVEMTQLKASRGWLPIATDLPWFIALVRPDWVAPNVQPLFRTRTYGGGTIAQRMGVVD